MKFLETNKKPIAPKPDFMILNFKTHTIIIGDLK